MNGFGHVTTEPPSDLSESLQVLLGMEDSDDGHGSNRQVLRHVDSTGSVARRELFSL